MGKMIHHHSRLAVVTAGLLLLALLPPDQLLAEGAGGATGGGRVYLSLDYLQHPTFGQAVKGSIAPTNLRANVRAVARNTLDPLNPARYIGAVFIIEAQRQIANGQPLDVGAIIGEMSPGGLAMGYMGAQGGDMLGATIQSMAARGAGPIGGLFGFALRPVLWYLGSTMGQSLGKGAEEGEISPSKAMASALREFNPTRDTFQMVGDAVFSVIGQALIPIPLVGAMVGGAVGGVIGLGVGKAVLQTESGRIAHEKLKEGLARLANVFEPRAGPVSTIAVQGTLAGDSSAASRTAVSTSVRARTILLQPEQLSPEAARAYRRFIAAMQGGDKAEIERTYAEYLGTRAAQKAARNEQ